MRIAGCWQHCQPALVLFVLFCLVACGSSPRNQQSAIQQPLSADVPRQIAQMDEEQRRRTVIFDVDMTTLPAELPDHWNPFLPYRRDKGLHQAMIEPFFILNYETGAIEPWLATQMSANATMDVWTLELREGVTWSDGEPFSADDVVFTLQLLLTYPELNAEFNPRVLGLGAMDDVRKLDDLTVEMRLSQPNPRFQLDSFTVKVWGHFPVVPEHIWRGKDPRTFKNYDPDKGWPVFTGPYTLQHFDKTTFVYVRDDAWWGARTHFKPLPSPERLIWVMTGDEATRASLAAAHHLDSIGDVSLDTFMELQAANPHIISWFHEPPYAWPDPCVRLLSLNNTAAPWNAKRMRWAINHALDRDAIVETAYQHTTVAARHFFPAYPPIQRYVQLVEDAGLYEEYPLLLHDPQRARELIEAQGWSPGSDGYYERDGQQLELQILVHTAFHEYHRLAAVIAEQLQAVGINATVEMVEAEQWLERKASGDYQAVADWDACDSVHEPWASMQRYHAHWVPPAESDPAITRTVTLWDSTQHNHIRWQHAEYSALMDEMERLPMGDPRIDSLFLDATRIWLDELPFIPIVQARKLVPFDTTYWVGWPTAENNYIHPPTWWQSTHIILHHLEPVSSP
jgi:peptide/nickel transport system substrate-binding protein